MKCEEIFDRTEEYLAGWLSDEECVEFEAHMAECGECRKNVEFAKSLNGVMGSMPSVEPPEDFLDKLHEKIASEKKAVAVYKKWQPYSALAACILLAVVIRTNVTDDLNKSMESLSMETPVPSQYSQTTDTVEESADVIADLQADSAGEVTGQTAAPVQTAAAEKKPSKADTFVSEQKAMTAETAEPSVRETVVPAATVIVPAESSAVMRLEKSVIDAAVEDVAEDTSPMNEPASIAAETVDNIDEVKINERVHSGGGGGSSGGGGGSVSSANAVIAAVAESAPTLTSKRVTNIISTEYKKTVESIMSELGISKDGAVYVATEDAYQNFIMKLEEAGIAFDGACSRTDGEVRFAIDWE